jgi:hypothetical protein
MQQISTFQDISSDFIQEVDLNGQLVFLRIVWNGRVEAFFIRITDQNENPLNGVKIVPNWPLFQNHKGFLDFDGDLVVARTDDEAVDIITYDNFGNGWGLFYLTPEEYEEWKDVNGF